MSFATKQATVGTDATLIAAARPGRRKITLVNHGTTDVLLGNVGVTTATGVLLAGAKGQTIVIDTSDAVYGIVAASTQAVSAIEHY